MEVKINKTTISLKKGDITQEDTDAIVNAANEALAGGSGVDGAIHRAGGPRIMEECRKIAGGCPTGQAVITSGGNLKARYVIHTVGPIYRGGKRNEPALLASAYRKSLELAAEKGLKTVSFPSLSTGAYGYPIEEASVIALETAIDFARGNTGIELIRFVLFSEDAYNTFKKTLDNSIPTP